MNCDELARWIGPLLDGELDARNTAEVQTHLAGCPACQRRYEVNQALSSNIRRLDLGYAAPASLRRRIDEALEAEASGGVGAAVGGKPPSSSSSSAPARVARGASGGRSGSRQWFMWAGWPVAVAASAMLATILLQQRSLEADDVVAAHIRSLLADHLSDVLSTSHHTVKPWFAGKIDFSPPVPDLTPLGFELVGGRLDYLQSQPVAAVIYRKHGHIINVLVGEPGHELDKLPSSGHTQGYSLRSWRQGGLDLVAISDIDAHELDNLQRGYESPPPPTPD
jgi:mycothiol system anti-sigma-R factor